MPAFDVTIQGKIYHVEVPDPGASPLQVSVDGEPFVVGIVGAEVGGRAQPLAAPPPPAPQPAALPAVARVEVARPIVPVGADVGDDIIAPMPGTILTIDVEVGQAVEASQQLCILEAMKMKNPIRATRAGTVAEIAVQPGQTVAYGALLVRLK